MYHQVTLHKTNNRVDILFHDRIVASNADKTAAKLSNNFLKNVKNYPNGSKFGMSLSNGRAILTSKGEANVRGIDLVPFQNRY